MVWGILKKDSVADAVAKIQQSGDQLDEAAVSTIAKAHGFVKGTGVDKGSYVHPKTGETITALGRNKEEFGHSRKDGSTIAAFKNKHGLEKHLASHGYVKEESIEDYSLEELQEFMVSEDFEQLDELSKTTLGNYIKKAANDKADTAFHHGYSAYNNSRHKPYSEPMYNKVHRGQENRNKGIKRAVTKLTRESIEQIDELNKTTLGNYYNAAKQDNKDHVDSRRSGDAEEAKWAKDRMAKRTAGMAAAKQRLNKEDVSETELDEMIAEVLSADQDAGKWIGDFVKSDAPQFAGKSKEKRKQMALAAYYAAQKKESTDYESFIELDEEADLLKTGAKEIKHANVKDKQDDQDTMEPRAKGERDFLDQLSVQVTDDPARDGSKTGADKLKHASEPTAKGPGSYDAKEKLGKQGVKEGTGEEASETASHEASEKRSGKKTLLKFKAEANKKGC